MCVCVCVYACACMCVCVNVYVCVCVYVCVFVCVCVHVCVCPFVLSYHLAYVNPKILALTGSPQHRQNFYVQVFKKYASFRNYVVPQLHLTPKSRIPKESAEGWKYIDIVRDFN